MRTITGAVILLAGVGGLGWWATTHQAGLIEGKIAASAKALDVVPVHNVDVQVSGRDITLTGTVDGPAEAETLLAAYNSIPGLREVRADWTVLPQIAPFDMGARWQDGAFVAEGHVPSDAVRAQLQETLGAGAAALALGAGAPDGWGDAALTGLHATRLLQEGELRIDGRQLTLTGIASTPEAGAAIEAALAKLPQGYQQKLTLDYLDDGTPPEYSVVFDANTGLRIDGKLPAGLTAEQLAGALNFVAHTGDARTGLLGTADGHTDRIAPFAEWLPEFEHLTLTRKGDELAVTGMVGAGVDAELVSAALTEALGQPVSMMVSTAKPADGSLRTNAATGAKETARAGYWLPFVSFTATPEECAAHMNEALSRSPITFVTGEARLDAKAVRVVNEMASVAALCVTEGALRAEIGGHTDSVGDAAANRALSEARATAVRAALIARGVLTDHLVARGFGETDPIETNDTEEGRAANRRTTVTWSPFVDGVNE